MISHETVLAAYPADTALEKTWNMDPGDGYTLDFKWMLDIELSYESWQFDLLGVFRHAPTGLLFTSHDSGCSCPTAWENHTVSLLKPLVTYQQWLDIAAGYVGTPPEPDAHGAEIFAHLVDDFEKARGPVYDHFQTLRARSAGDWTTAGLWEPTIITHEPDEDD